MCVLFNLLLQPSHFYSECNKVGHTRNITMYKILIPQFTKTVIDIFIDIPC